MAKPQLVIRIAQPADFPALSAIWFTASSAAHSFLGNERLKEQQILIEQKYLPQAETWVAEDNGQPVGFIGLLDNYIGGLFVAPGQQGKGVGQALVDHARKLKGELEVGVYSMNERAHTFYQHLGFEELHRHPEDEEGLPFEIIRLRSSSRS